MWIVIMLQVTQIVVVTLIKGSLHLIRFIVGSLI